MKSVTFKNKQLWLEARSKVITSTDVASLFGCSPYQTIFELWHRKKSGDIIEIEENERMTWGSRLEESIARGVSDDRGWLVRPMKEFLFDDELKIGSSFDFEIMQPTKALLEIKNVDSLQYSKNWIEHSDIHIEAPPHIELQIQHQMYVTGHTEAYLAALVGGNTLKVILRERDDEVIRSIEDAVKLFWKSIDDNRPPDPDFKRDAATLKAMFNKADADSIFDGTQNQRLESLAMVYKTYSDDEKAAAENKEATKAEILTIIQGAEKTIGNNYTISAGMIGPCQMNYERKGYRNFRINYKRSKV